jgi:formylglycine-generating enzyme required for sulfatase activity
MPRKICIHTHSRRHARRRTGWLAALLVSTVFTVLSVSCSPPAEKPALSMSAKPEMVIIPAGSLDIAWQEFEVKLDTTKKIQDGVERITNIDTITTARMRKNTLRSRGFQITRFEITQEQYEAVMGDNPSYFSGKHRPVENVSYEDAIEFCRRLCEREAVAPNTYRLPTQEEWEFACRAGGGADYAPSNIAPDTPENSSQRDAALAPIAWYAPNAGEQTHTVGMKKPNAFGLYDMHGNVAEWLAGGNERSVAMIGGSWKDRGFNVRASSVYSVSWWMRKASHDRFTNYIGFRIVR